MYSVADSAHRVTDRGAGVAAGRIGCTVEQYRQHEADNEAWCSGHRSWHTRSAFAAHANRPNGLQGSCRAASAEYADRRRLYTLATDYARRYEGISYAGPAFSLTPKGAAAMMPSAAALEGRSDATAVAYPDRSSSGHLHCPPSIRDLCEGRLPVGWARTQTEESA